MATSYDAVFVDKNGETRIAGTLTFTNGEPTFNGGTITQPLVIATTDGNIVPLTVEASWNAQHQDFFQVVNTDTNTRMFAVDVDGQTLAYPHDSETTRSLVTIGTGAAQAALGGGAVVGLTDTGVQKVGFFSAVAVAQPTGVAVSAAGIHAALVSLGLITA